MQHLSKTWEQAERSFLCCGFLVCGFMFRHLPSRATIGAVGWCSNGSHQTALSHSSCEPSGSEIGIARHVHLFVGNSHEVPCALRDGRFCNDSCGDTAARYELPERCRSLEYSIACSHRSQGENAAFEFPTAHSKSSPVGGRAPLACHFVGIFGLQGTGTIAVLPPSIVLVCRQYRTQPSRGRVAGD